jgi:hypothetical protein
VLLGKFLDQFLQKARSKEQALEKVNALHYETFSRLIKEVSIYNPWFTEEFVLEALDGICHMLKREHLEKWLFNYPELYRPDAREKIIGIVMAGNIPLVGFHDFLCIMVSGNRVMAKPSSKDEHLIKAMADILVTIDPSFSDRITFAEEYLSGMDAVIATGSNNTSRYFQYYFRNIPAIIRKNRNSIAVLTGTESDSQLMDLGKDIFTFFGLGCRNVTKIYIPENYDLIRLMSIYESYGNLCNHNKYGNNVDYYRTIFLMNRIPFLDNGALLLKEDPAMASPVGVVYYEKYSDIEVIKQLIEANRNQLQCIVSVDPAVEGAILPGSTQKPFPWDYADGVDTLRFLTEI